MEIFFSRPIKFFSLAILFSAQAFAQAQADFPTNAETDLVNTSNEEYTAVAAPGRLLSTHPTGAIGLTHTVSALKQPAGPYSFGLFMAGNYYSHKGFPASTPAYITERFDSNFGFSYTPNPLFEVFFGLGFLTTNDEAPINPLYRQNANIQLGGKVTYPFTSSITAGGMYVAEKRSDVSVIPGSKFALNHTLLGVVTYDNGSPFRYNANLGLRIDNNTRVVAGATNDQRQLTLFHVYGGQVVPIALSAEYLWKWLDISAEYSMDYVLGSSAGFAGNPQRVTLGSRIFPTKDQAFALHLAFDIGLSSTNVTTVVKEPPYSFWFGLTYLFGQQKKGAVVMEQQQQQQQTFTEQDFPKESKKDKSSSDSQGRISGYITNIETGDPIENVKLFLCNDPSNPIVTDSSGRFRSFPLKNGPCEVRLEHPNYKTTTETVTVSGDAEQSFDFGLLQQSKEKGALLIRVKDAEGNPTAATISFPEHPELNPVDTNEFGQAKIQITAGKYAVRAKAPKMKSQTNKVELVGKDLFVDFALEPDAPAKPVVEAPAPKPIIKVSQDKKTIDISEKIQFEVDKALLTYNSTRVLDDVVKFMKKHTEIKKVQIGGHTDSTGTPEKNMKLSADRAESVKNYLAKKGIDKKRLESKGFGQTKPISDNKTDEGKYQNRRVEFKILNPAPPAAKGAAKPATSAAPAAKTATPPKTVDKKKK